MSVVLNARSRQVTGKKVKQLRRDGMIPAVLFGRGTGSREVVVQALEFSRLEHRITPTTLMDITVDDEAPVKALLHHVQMDPRTRKPLHLELHQVRMEDTIHAEVPIVIEGTAPAVAEHGGTLVQVHNTVQIAASPDHLVPSFHLNVSTLNSFDDHIRAGDIPLPEGVELLIDPETILVSVMAPRRPEEEAEGEPVETIAQEEAAAGEE